MPPFMRNCTLKLSEWPSAQPLWERKPGKIRLTDINSDASTDQPLSSTNYTRELYPFLRQGVCEWQACSL